MPISSAALELLLTRWRDDVLIYLMTITHPSLETVRLARNNETVTSRGTEFSAAPFDITWPPDNEGAPQGVQVSIPNVDRAIGRALMKINHSMEVTLEAVFASNPDDVWKRIARLELFDVSFQAIVLTGHLAHRRITNEPFPNRRVIPNKFHAYYR